MSAEDKGQAQGVDGSSSAPVEVPSRLPQGMEAEKVEPLGLDPFNKELAALLERRGDQKITPGQPPASALAVGAMPMDEFEEALAAMHREREEEIMPGQPLAAAPEAIGGAMEEVEDIAASAASLINYSSYFVGVKALNELKIADFKKDLDSLGDIDPNVILETHARSVGSLVEIEDQKDQKELSFLGTAVVVGRNIIVSARHCVNGIKLGDLKFLINGQLYSLSLIEDGADHEEDYILLRAIPSSELGKDQPNLTHCIPLGADLPGNEYILAIGMNNDELSAGMCFIPVESHAPLEQLTVFDSTYGFSGAPYIRADGRMIGLHLKSEQLVMFSGQKSGLSFNVLTQKKNLLFTQYMLTGRLEEKKKEESDVSGFTDEDVFDDYSSSGGLGIQVDEGAKRKHIFSNTPSLTSKAGREILKRWELARGLIVKKAIYSGKESKEMKKYKDLSKWKVLLFQEEDAKRKPISLNEKRTVIKKEKPVKVSAVQMGHKLSCSAYWNEGSSNYIKEREKRIKEKYKAVAQHAIRDKKLENLHKIYDEYKTPFKEIYKSFHEKDYKKYKELRQKFMLNSKNYRFEWWKLNEKNGTGELEHEAPDGYEWHNNKLVKLS